MTLSLLQRMAQCRVSFVPLVVFLAGLPFAGCTAKTRELGRECLPDKSVCVVLRTGTPFEEISAGFFFDYNDAGGAGPCTVLYVVTAPDSTPGPPSPCIAMPNWDLNIQREFVQYYDSVYYVHDRKWR